METQSAHTKQTIWLLGEPLDRISGHKLPSKGQVLRRLFYLIRQERKTAKEAASIVTHEVEGFWEKARIPTKQTYNIIPKVINLHENYRKVQKHVNRRSPAQEKLEADFTGSVDDLFDIAHADALSLIENEEDKQFLLAQREKGRRGHMTRIKKVLEPTEAHQMDLELKNKTRLENMLRRMKKVDLEIPTST